MPRHVLLVVLAGCVACPVRAADPVFTNQSTAAGVAVVHDASGFNNVQYSGGGTAGDFNGDGWQDFFMFSGGDLNQPDYLFINNGDGTFTNQSAAWGITGAHKGKGSAVADYDDDGDLDLYVTSAGPAGQAAGPGHHKLWRNNGNGTFTQVASAAGVATTNPSVDDAWGATFGDYDRDGDLDLLVAGFQNGNNGTRLFSNDGDGTFTDVTAAVGFLAGVPSMAYFSPALVDMDGDWWPDILAVADFGSSRYFKSDGDGTFTEFSAAAGTAEEENGMGQCRGDFNNDGRLDWYVTSIYFPSIGWTGNKLYLNGGGHHYTEHAASAGVNDGGYGWGALAVDFNHDGLVDIAETNGDNSSNGAFANEQSYLWRNNGSTFTEMAVSAGLIHNGKGRGMLNFDYDNDGDQDVLIFAYNQQLRLFRNEIAGPGTNWLRVFLDTSERAGLPPDGFGARVYATAGGVTQMRMVEGGNTYLGVCELSAHFGLGVWGAVQELRVEWPDGTVTVLNDLAANQTLTVSAGKPTCTADVTGDGIVDVSDLVDVVLSWGPCPGCDADITGDEVVDVSDLVGVILAWGSC
jgi:hypothetical protein